MPQPPRDSNYWTVSLLKFEVKSLNNKFYVVIAKEFPSTAHDLTPKVKSLLNEFSDVIPLELPSEQPGTTTHIGNPTCN